MLLDIRNSLVLTPVILLRVCILLICLIVPGCLPLPGELMRQLDAIHLFTVARIFPPGLRSRCLSPRATLFPMFHNFSLPLGLKFMTSYAIHTFLSVFLPPPLFPNFSFTPCPLFPPNLPHQIPFIIKTPVSFITLLPSYFICSP